MEIVVHAFDPSHDSRMVHLCRFHPPLHPEPHLPRSVVYRGMCHSNRSYSRKCQLVSLHSLTFFFGVLTYSSSNSRQGSIRRETRTQRCSGYHLCRKWSKRWLRIPFPLPRHLPHGTSRIRLNQRFATTLGRHNLDLSDLARLRDRSGDRLGREENTQGGSSSTAYRP